MTIGQPSSALHWTVTPAMRRMWLALALATVLLARLATLWWSEAGLHVDEAQYWVWAQQLDWGYFSKPPGIAVAIRLSTALFGDSLTGIRLVCMVCWLGSAALLYHLGARMHSPAAGAWAALVLTASPASCLLGLVATTDALLMLGWCATMALAWQAVHAPRWRLAWWLATGLAWGLTLQCKYTALALAPSLLWVAVATQHHAAQQVATPARPASAGLVTCCVAAVLVWSPNLIWNGLHHWPTLGHTAHITLNDGDALVSSHIPLNVAAYLAGVLLLVGPAGCLVQLCRVRTARSPSTATLLPLTLQWAACFVWPLLLAGLLQSLRGGGQLNWAAPVVAGMSLQAGCWLAAHPRCQRRTLTAAAAGWLLCTLVAASQDLRAAWPFTHHTHDRPLDFWHKTRHWDALLQTVGHTLPSDAPCMVTTGARDVHVQAAYAWRGRPIALKAWAPGPSPRHHFEFTQPLTQPYPAELYWLDREPPPPQLTQQYRTAKQVQRVSQGALTLQLWVLHTPSGEGAMP